MALGEEWRLTNTIFQQIRKLTQRTVNEYNFSTNYNILIYVFKN